ncbi:hypothetical protein ACET3Z_000110 [Daucus carota]
MDLDFDKYCVLDGSPDTVLPSPRHSSKSDSKKVRGIPKCGNDLLSRKKGFADISFQRYRSASCKTIQHRTECHYEVQRRGSVYQSSQETRNMKEMRDDGSRRKIEFPRSSATALSFGIIDSLCNSDEDDMEVEQNRPTLKSRNRDSLTSLKKAQNLHLAHPLRPILEKGVSAEANQLAEEVERQMITGSKGRHDPVIRPLRNGNRPREIDSSFTLHKSLSAKLALPHSPSHSESDCSNSSSPRSRFSPMRKVFDPFTKSKLQRSSLDSASKCVEVSSVKKGCNTRALCKPPLHDSSNMFSDAPSDSQSIEKECDKTLRSCSPAHLRATMKLLNKHGVLSYEFSVQSLEQIIVAKAWQIGNARDWVYTFHNCQNKRKSHASGREFREGNKVSSMVGQMQVSCSLYAELEDARDFDNSLRTEFVLYDVAQVRKSLSTQSSSLSLLDTATAPIVSNEASAGGACKLDVSTESNSIKHRQKHFSEDNILRPTELHTNLEIAAIVIEVPFEKRESLKGKKGDQKSDEPLHDLLVLPGTEQRTDCSIPAKVNVVTTSGNHSMPTTESPGPSGLLDRWKLSGSCDCGGWDMGCPLVVFGSSDIRCAKDVPIVTGQQPWELYAQGRKEEAPSFRMTVTKEGEYEVDFHAQLTTLQAFSIGVAILHCTEIASVHERNKKLLKCDPLRFFVDEGVKCLIDSITLEKKRKAGPKIETPQSFKLDPPFSPIGRV